MPELEEQEQPQAKTKREKKPSWSLDVKIISHVSDMLDACGDLAERLEAKDGNAYAPLKFKLQESYLSLGGNIASEGNMLLPEAKTDLDTFFNKLAEWEKLYNKATQEEKMNPDLFRMLTEILRMIRSILYSERNRLFVKFITIYTSKEIETEQALGRG